ncbi:MAG: gliding motility-associated C-terminal domain-containing protein [Lewinellaceae bacterium]|nr:gliding motility-associated C-terminal domain-containing protein [Saprospiraceae bacterium]MCB9340369.1 gliding motility-associated C-terminal domain-containing protein [Lewinellaceae bacterium]
MPLPFTLFAGAKVVRINSFHVFELRGKTVFQAANIFPNQLSSGWDGNCGGKAMNSGVYVWMAAVEFADGTTRQMNGEITLIR